MLLGIIFAGHIQHNLWYAQSAVHSRAPVKVLVTGLERSGSTWMYLVVQLLMQTVYTNSTQNTILTMHAHSAQDVLEMDGCVGTCTTSEPAPDTPCVVKIHEYEPALLMDFDAVVTSHRDLRDVRMSVSQTFGSCLDDLHQPANERGFNKFRLSCINETHLSVAHRNDRMPGDLDFTVAHHYNHKVARNQKFHTKGCHVHFSRGWQAVGGSTTREQRVGSPEWI